MTLQQAIDKSSLPFDAIAYKYNISPPTLRKAYNGEEPKQHRVKQAIEKIIKNEGK